MDKQQVKDTLSYDTGYAFGKSDGRAEGIGFYLKSQLENLIEEYQAEIDNGIAGGYYTDEELYRRDGALMKLEDVVSDLQQLLKTKP